MQKSATIRGNCPAFGLGTKGMKAKIGGWEVTAPILDSPHSFPQSWGGGRGEQGNYDSGELPKVFPQEEMYPVWSLLLWKILR